MKSMADYWTRSKSMPVIYIIDSLIFKLKSAYDLITAGGGCYYLSRLWGWGRCRTCAMLLVEEWRELASSSFSSLRLARKRLVSVRSVFFSFFWRDRCKLSIWCSVMMAWSNSSIASYIFLINMRSSSNSLECPYRLLYAYKLFAGLHDLNVTNRCS